MKKRWLIRMVTMAAVSILAAAARADTLLWYRFDGGDANVVNRANPGTMDGTLKNVTTWGALSGLTDWTTKPARGDASFPSGTWLMDRHTDTLYSDTVKSLTWSGSSNDCGVVFLSKADAAPLVNLTSFTCEALFKIPASAASRSGDVLFPIVEWGIEGNSQGWLFGLRYMNSQFIPFFRGSYKKSPSATGGTNSDFQPAVGITADVWHHLAITVNGTGDGTPATVKLFLDYTSVGSTTVSDYYGFYFNSASAYPFTVGAALYRTALGCFMGEIAELRISDTALSDLQMLTPVPSGPVDDGTLVYLPMGDCNWFGSESTFGYANRYFGALNAAPTSALDPRWLLGSTVPIAAYPAASEESIGETVRDGYLSNVSYDDTGSILFSRTLNSGSSAYNGHVLYIPDPENPTVNVSTCTIPSGDFTLEFFFKTDGQVASGNVINSYTFLNCSWAKILINQTNGKLLTRLVKSDGFNDWNSLDRVDDGEWHHYALVYDHASGRFSVWLDYRQINYDAYVLTTVYTSNFYFGGEHGASQGFSGHLDDLRITRRKLTAHEFLNTRALVSGISYLDARFEDDLSTGQDAVLAPSGTGYAFPGGSMPTFVDVNCDIKDGDGASTRTSAKALRLDGGYVAFPRNTLLERNDFTVEFFAKLDSLADSANLLRFSQGDAVNNSPIWTLFYRESDGGSLQLAAYMSADGTSSGAAAVYATLHAGSLTGGWHHWALTVEAVEDGTRTVFKVYRDYTLYGETVFNGLLAIPYAGSCLSIGGTGVSTALIHGAFDELRFRPGVQDVSTFMRHVPTGTTVFFR